MEHLWKALDDLREAISARVREVERLRARLDVEEAELQDLRRMQVRFWDRVTSERQWPSRMTSTTIEDLPPAIPVTDGTGMVRDEGERLALKGVPEPNLVPRQEPQGHRPSEHPDPAPASIAGDAIPAKRSRIRELQELPDDDDDMYDREMAVELIRDLRVTSDGQAPRGFAAAVRHVAHRSIFKAGRPLRRNDILAEVRRAGIPLPEQHEAMKVTRVLTRDPDLVRDEKGYRLSDWALSRQRSIERDARQRREGEHKEGD